jgi:predicted Zn-dependent protease
MRWELESTLIRWGILLAIGLILYGVVGSELLMGVVLLFVIWRGIIIIEQIVFNKQLSSSGKRTHLKELAGLFGWVLLMPLSVGLLTEPFFAVGLPWSWSALWVVLLGLGVYYLPTLLNRRRIGVFSMRTLLWVVPAPIFLVSALVLIELRHPYLKTWEPDRYALAVERIFALDSIVLAGRHAHWVQSYAEELDEQGERDAAIHYYREALLLDTQLKLARERLLEWGEITDVEEGSFSSRWADSDTQLEQLSYVTIDSSLAELAEFTVIIVPIGDVHEGILLAIANAIQTELDVPTVIADIEITLPRHDRRRGLSVGPQWKFSTIGESFVGAVSEWPQAPLRYLVVTPVDIYAPRTNFIFSVSFDWGGVMGLARYGNPSTDNELVAERASKQAVSTIIKSFPITPSRSRDCVTAYTRTIEEFDAKSKHPSADILQAFRHYVNEANRDWRMRLSRSQ